LTKTLKALLGRGWKAERTPYPQKHQQRLGVILTTLWKTAGTPRKAAIYEVFSWRDVLFDHYLIKDLQATFRLARSVERTSYPQKRQQRLGANIARSAVCLRQKNQ